VTVLNTHEVLPLAFVFLPSKILEGNLPLAPKMEKEPDYEVGPTEEELSKLAARRGSKANEASDLYGDIQTAEEYGYVTRG